MDGQREKTFQVPEEEIMLSRAIESLGDVVSILYERLDTVLREPVLKKGHTDAEVSPDIEETLVPLAANIRDSRRLVQMETERLSELIARLEV